MVRQNTMTRGCSRTNLLSSWWPGSREKKMPAFLPSSPIIPHGHPVYKMVAALIQGGSSLVSLLWKNPQKQPDTCFTNLISISFFFTVYVYICVSLSKCAHACGSQRTTPGSFPGHHSPCFFETESLIDVEFAK